MNCIVKRLRSYNIPYVSLLKDDFYHGVRMTPYVRQSLITDRPKFDATTTLRLHLSKLKTLNTRITVNSRSTANISLYNAI